MNNANLVKEIFEKAAFVRELGIELTSFGKGWCETQMPLSPSLRHGEARWNDLGARVPG